MANLLKLNPVQMLKMDHRKVSAIFKALMLTTNRGVKKRETLFHELKTNLDMHARLEEEIFYPAVRDAKPTHEIVLESYEEHHLMKHLLSELDEMDKGTDEWKAKLVVLQELIKHHVREEEKEMLPKAQKILGKEEMNQIGEEMRAARENLKMRFVM